MIKNLRKLRKEKGISQQSLARSIGVSQQSINKYENHDIEPDIQTLSLIADCFGTSVDYLIGRTELNRPTGLYTQEDLTKEEKLLLHSYRSLDAKERNCVNTVIESFIKNK